jgi:DNA-binding CsgD family transcriptional regulator
MNTLTRTTNRLVRFIKTSGVQPSVTQKIVIQKGRVIQPSANLLQGVMEGLIDGVMLITAKGELIHANCHALQICQQFNSDLVHEGAIPQAVWQCCQAVVDSRELFPQHSLTIEDEISSPVGAIRIRVRWLTVEDLPQSCLLVTLEDQSQSAQYRAIAESIKYGLTARETDVWRLKRAGCSYKEIAARLFLAENTVKKHIKNIHVKRAAAL